MFKLPFIRASLLLVALVGLRAEFTPGVVVAHANQSAAAGQVSGDEAIRRTWLIIEQVIRDSYPELKGADIQIKTFNSDADYFRTIFSFGRFASGRKMRYVIKVNPRVFELAAPEDGIRAILAHELGHVYDFHRQKRIRLLGLARLATKGYTARFERWTDLQAIARGYGEGLKAYRRWLYQHIPPNRVAGKRRDYFSPEEIDAIEAKRRQNPGVMAYWFKHVPLSLQEIEAR